MKRTSHLAFLLLLVLPCVTRAEELRVFYTGHSFHMFVPAKVAQMTKAAKITDYQLAGVQGIGGSRVIQHWNYPEEKNKAKRILEKGGADIFTMAPHVKIPDEGIDHFVELGLKNNPKMRFLIQESWVPFDLLENRIKANADRDKADPAKLRPDQEKWRGEMEAQAKVLNKKAGRQVVYIVPAGDAVLKLRELIVAGKAPGIKTQSELFTDPIGHGKGTLQILVAYCNYACITGQSPVGLKVSEPGVSPELNALLQQIAWDTVTAYPMSGVKAGK